jgi:hypothetical protein
MMTGVKHTWLQPGLIFIENRSDEGAAENLVRGYDAAGFRVPLMARI